MTESNGAPINQTAAAAYPRAKPALQFQQVRRQHQLTLEQIALKAELPVRTVYTLEIGVPVGWNDAIDCVHALSVLAGHYYQLEHFSIRIKPEVLMDAPTLPLYAVQIQKRERR